MPIFVWGSNPGRIHRKPSRRGTRIRVEFTEYRFIPYFLSYFGDQQPGITSYINGGDSPNWFIGFIGFIFWFIGLLVSICRRIYALTNKQVNK